MLLKIVDLNVKNKTSRKIRNVKFRPKLKATQFSRILYIVICKAYIQQSKKNVCVKL